MLDTQVNLAQGTSCSDSRTQVNSYSSQLDSNPSQLVPPQHTLHAEDKFYCCLNLRSVNDVLRTIVTITNFVLHIWCSKTDWILNVNGIFVFKCFGTLFYSFIWCSPWLRNHLFCNKPYLRQFGIVIFTMYQNEYKPLFDLFAVNLHRISPVYYIDLWYKH